MILVHLCMILLACLAMVMMLENEVAGLLIKEKSFGNFTEANWSIRARKELLGNAVHGIDSPLKNHYNPFLCLTRKTPKKTLSRKGGRSFAS